MVVVDVGVHDGASISVAVDQPQLTAHGGRSNAWLKELLQLSRGNQMG
jgi:hypothetical protein